MQTLGVLASPKFMCDIRKNSDRRALGVRAAFRSAPIPRDVLLKMNRAARAAKEFWN